MRRLSAIRSKLGLVVLSALALALPAQAQWAVASVRSIDHVLADARYLLKMAGKEDLVTQMDGFLSSYIGKGVDSKRPLGFYVSGFGDKPPAVLFVPVTDEKEFVELLKGFGVEVGEAEKGVRGIDLPGGEKVYLRFEKKYAFASQLPELLKGDLPDPAQNLTAAGRNNLLAFSLRLDQIPPEAKQQLFKKMDEDLKRDMEKRDGESEGEHQARVFGMKLVAGLALQLATEGKEFAVAFNIDQAQHNLSLDVALVGKPGTALAKSIQEFGAARSVFSGLTLDAAASMFFKLPIPADLRKALNSVVDRGFQEALNREQSPLKKAIAEKIFQTLEPTLKSESLDAALMLNGPLAGEKFAVVGAIKVKDGLKIEALVKDLIQQMPEAEKKKGGVRLDLAKAGGASIHAFLPPEKDERARQIFGSQEIFLAFKDDMALMSMGTHGEAQLKQALEALESKKDATRSVPMQAEMAFSRIVPMIPEDAEKAAKAAKEAFTGPRQDRIRASVSGGDSLHLRLDVSAYFIKFGAAMAGLDG